MTLKNLIRYLRVLLSNHPVKTVWFNFRMLPFSQAIYLPILLCGKTKFRDLSGEIIIENKKFEGGGNSRIRPFMIKIGRSDSYIHHCKPLDIWTIKGRVVFVGPISIFAGTYVMVSTNGTLKLGTKNTFIGSNSTIICFDNVVIGDNVGMAWNTQIYDSNFHYTRTVGESSGVSKLTSPVVIGDNCWIGNNSTFTRGCRLPDNSIVCNNSLMNKDYSSCGEYCMYAGMPARVVKHNIEFVNINSVEEHDIDLQMGYVRDHL